jgi:RNase P/RNase MRP subunit p29
MQAIRVILCISLLSSRSYGVDIVGKIQQVEGSLVRVSVDSDLIPRPGDKFQIYFQISGLDEPVDVGTGVMVELDGDLIVARIEKASGKVAKNHQIKFSSDQPQSRKASMTGKSTPGKTNPQPLIPDNPRPADEIWFSDAFERAEGSSSLSERGDLALGGTRIYSYIPLFPARTTGIPSAIGAKIIDGTLENIGRDFGGVQFSTPMNLRGSNVGQDLNIKVDLLLPSDDEGYSTEGGPFFRSRAASAGDGVIGGRSAGYWVQLHSDGKVQVKCLNPLKTIAEARQPETFDSKSFHQLEIAARGNELQVALDGLVVEFETSDGPKSVVSIPSAWNGPPAIGDNQGAAGVMFSAENNRGQFGGQRADNLAIGGYRPLTDR